MAPAAASAPASTPAATSAHSAQTADGAKRLTGASNSRITGAATKSRRRSEVLENGCFGGGSATPSEQKTFVSRSTSDNADILAVVEVPVGSLGAEPGHGAGTDQHGHGDTYPSNPYPTYHRQLPPAPSPKQQQHRRAAYFLQQPSADSSGVTPVATTPGLFFGRGTGLEDRPPPPALNPAAAPNSYHNSSFHIQPGGRAGRYGEEQQQQQQQQVEEVQLTLLKRKTTTTTARGTVAPAPPPSTLCDEIDQDALWFESSQENNDDPHVRLLQHHQQQLGQQPLQPLGQRRQHLLQQPQSILRPLAGCGGGAGGVGVGVGGLNAISPLQERQPMSSYITTTAKSAPNI